MRDGIRRNAQKGAGRLALLFSQVSDFLPLAWKETETAASQAEDLLFHVVAKYY